MRAQRLLLRAAVAVAALALPAACWALGASGKGTSSAQFLKLPVGARGAAMGEAQTAVADDATAIVWNPAGLSAIKDQAVSFMHAELLSGVSYEFLGYGLNLKRDRGALGASLQYLSVPRIEETDASGFKTGASIAPRDMALSLGYAHSIPLGFEESHVGVAGKYISSSLTRTESTFAVDAGAISGPLTLQDRELRVGLAVQNMGAGLKYDAEAQPLPLNFKIGAGLHLTRRWLLAVDINYPRDNNAYAAVGTEYWVKASNDWSFAGRAGLNSRSMGETGGLGGFSFGLGARMGGWGLDYGLAPTGVLGLMHRVSLSCAFGGGGSIGR